jgi:hypothetical protein
MSRVTLEGKPLSETCIQTFDFTSRLTAAETISTASVTAIVYSGTDAAPGSLISGTTTISGKTVTQKVAGGVLGVTYLLKCSITTSLGQTLALSGFLPVVPDAAS